MAEHTASVMRMSSIPTLLRIPLDIRHSIYDFLFPDNTRHIRCARYIYNHRFLRERIPTILLVNKQLLEEVRAYIFKTTTFVAVLGALHPLEFYTDSPKPRLEAGLARLSALLAFVRHLTLSISIGGHDINEASIFLLHYFRDCFNNAYRPLGRLRIQFTTSQWPQGLPGVRNLRASLANSQCFRDSCAEVLLAARYIRSDNMVNIDIPEEVPENYPETCSVHQAFYDMHLNPCEQSSNYFADHDTLMNIAMKRISPCNFPADLWFLRSVIPSLDGYLHF